MANRIELLIEVATLYYEQNCTQTYIAKKLNISRPTVASLLQEARDKGIVKISIMKINKDTIDISNSIKEKYNIPNVFVSKENTVYSKKEVGILCANYIESKKDTNIKIGVGFGSTVYEYVKSANYIKTNFKGLIPIMGGVELNDEALHSNHLCYTLSRKYSCNMRFFYAPVKAESLAQKKMLIDSHMVKSAIEEAKKVDLAIVGVGNPLNMSTYQKLHYILDEDLDILEKNEAVGDIVTSLFNKDAEEIITPSSEKFIGLSIYDLKNIPEVVVLATGYQKSEAVKALISNKIVSTLIIDYELANILISS